jgi:hypothetical protein
MRNRITCRLLKRNKGRITLAIAVGLSPHIRLWINLPVAAFLATATSVAQAPQQPVKPPRFEDYGVSNIYRGPVKPPYLGDPKQYDEVELHCFGGDSAEYSYAQVRANFAGHFVIEACTCGSGCHSLYMWDALTGKFFRNFPAMPIDVGPGVTTSGWPAYAGEVYRLDSSLLIVDGCVEDTCDCGRRYYNWNGSKFNLILKQATIPAPPPSCPR